MKKYLIIIASLLSVLTAVAQAKVIYVNGSSGNTVEDGKTWATSYKTIEQAISNAESDNEIWVAKGEYAPVNTYRITQNLNLYGGFAGTENSLLLRDITANETVLRGGSEPSSKTLFNHEKNAKLIIDGFSWTNYGGGTNSSFQSIDGVPDLTANDRFYLRINNCKFYDGGQPVSFSVPGTVEIENSTFVNNINLNFNDNTFHDTVTNSVAKVNVRIVNSTFSNYQRSNILYCARVNLEIINCEFFNNTNNVFNIYNVGRHTFKDCKFHDNPTQLINTGGSYENSYITLNNVEMDNNSSTSNVLSFSGFSVVMDGVNYTRNKGNIYMSGCSFDFKNSTFSHNETYNGYNLIDQFGQMVTNPTRKIENCKFNNNTTAGMNTTSIVSIRSSEKPVDFLRCEFKNNVMTGSALYSLSSLIVNHCVFDSCVSKNNNGGAINLTTDGSIDEYGIITNTTFKRCSSDVAYGGAMFLQARMEIKDCEFIENFADVYGGAIYSSPQSTIYTLNIENTKFIKNHANLSGGVAYSGTFLKFKNCEFVENYALGSNRNTSATGTGVIHLGENCRGNCAYPTCEIFNCVIRENKYIEALLYGKFKVYNSTIVGNSCTLSRFPDYTPFLISQHGYVSAITDIRNSIFWSNNLGLGGKSFYEYSYVSQSNVQGGFAGEGNTDLDPKFVDESAGNLRLTCASPLINKGNNTYAPEGLDLDGKTRVFAGTVDMGAYEFPQDPATATAPPTVVFSVSNTNACKSEILSFGNTTTPFENTKFEWDFGDGIKSSEAMPTHAYSLSGTFTVSLKATNACGATATATRQVTIKPSFAPTISVATVVCPNEKSEFSTDAQCGTLTWSVTGGSIIGGQGTKNIQVQWGNGSTGNGKVTLNVDNCGAGFCNIPVSIEIPIIPTIFEVAGNNKVCQGGVETYSSTLKDASPSTLYTWQVFGGTLASTKASGYELTSMKINWGTTDTLGKVVLTTYNELLKCGGTDTLFVALKPKFVVSGTDKVCTGKKYTYNTQPSGNFIWLANGSSAINQSSGEITWGSVAGPYWVLAQPLVSSDYCNSKDSLQIELVEMPEILSIAGPQEVDSTLVQTYVANTKGTDITYTWQVIGGQNVGGAGNQILVNWNGPKPHLLELTISTRVGSCIPPKASLSVKTNFVYKIIGLDEVCINTPTTYTSNSDPSFDPEIFNWSGGTGTAVDSTYSVSLTQPGYQYINLKVQRNGKELTASKKVYVNASISGLSIKGTTEIAPTGTGTYVYTVSNPKAVNYTYTVAGASTHSRNGDQITVTWGGTEPFKITLNGNVAGDPCPGIPVLMEVKKAPALENKILSGGGACLNSTVDYSFVKDEHTSNLRWTLSGGGTIVATGDSDIEVLWGSVSGTYTVTLTYDRFGTQTATLPVVVNTLPNVEIADQTICGANPTPLRTTLSFVSYRWSLEGDSYTTTEATPSIAKEGLYKVAVTDVNGCSALNSKYIKQIPIPEVAIYTNASDVYCQNATGNSNITLKTLEGNAYTYQWYLNDQQINGADTSMYSFNFPHANIVNHKYTIKTSVGVCSKSVDRYFKVIPASQCDGDPGGTCTEPEVRFTVNAGCQPYTFTNISSAQDQSSWSFGDGSTYVGATPDPKTYGKVGIFDVYLTRKCQAFHTQVEVPAVAIFKLESPGCNGKTLSFKDYSANLPGLKIVSWTWNFGDGTGDITTQDGGSGKDKRDITYTFATAKTYVVTLTVRAKNSKGDLCEHSSKQNVIITASPALNFTIKSAGCTSMVYEFQDQSTLATLQAKYLWTFQTGSTSTSKNAAFEYTSTGNKTVTLQATDLWGCQSSLSKSLTVVTPLVKDKIVVSGDLLLCNGKTVTLTSPNGTSYLWKRGNTTVATTATYTASLGGKYTVTYSNPTCSITTDTVHVQEYKITNVIVGNSKGCTGDALYLGTGLEESKYGFVWKFGTTTLPFTGANISINDINTTNTGNYSVAVTDKGNGCAVTLPTFKVEVNDKPAKPVVVVDQANVCFGAEFALSTSSNTTGHALQWYKYGQATGKSSNPSKFSNTSEAESGAYQLQLTNLASTCYTFSDPVSVKVYPQLSVTVKGDAVVCEQYPFALSSELSNLDYDFDWMRNGVSLGYNNNNKYSLSSIALMDTGKYTVKIISKGTSNYKGCSAVSAPFAVAVKEGPTMPKITGPDEFCEGSEISLSSSVNSNIKWGTGETSQSIKVTLGGSYTVTTTNTATGCILSSTKSVVQHPAPNFSFYPAGIYERCGSDKIYFEGLTSYPYYQWYVDGVKFKSPNKALYPTKSGAYTLEIRTDKGCVGRSDTMFITSLECPCYVTNTKDAGDGSLREAINCSNSKEGKDIIKFAITNEGTGPFVIKPLTALPTLTDSVTIDGFSQSGAGVYDIVINGSTYTKNALTLDYSLANCRIAGLVFEQFDNSIAFKPLVNNNLVENNKFVGNKGNSVELASNCSHNKVFSNTFETTGNAIALVSESQNNAIEGNVITAAQIGVGVFNKSRGNTIKGNQISNATVNGLLIYTGSSQNLVKGNTIGKSADYGISIENAKRNTLDSNYIGINALGANIGNGKSGIYIPVGSDSNTVSKNYISYNLEQGIHVEAALCNILSNNMTVANGKLGILSTGTQNTIAYNLVSNHTDYGILVNSNCTVLRNTLKDNQKGGIYVISSENKISKNTITNVSVAVKAIDLHISQRASGNQGKTPASFGSYRKSASGGIVLKGTSIANDSVEIFHNNNIAQQALVYVGSAKTNDKGVWELEIPAGDYFDPSTRNYYVNTATTTVNNTSELSSPFVSGCFDCICLVENVNNAGEGSLRAAVDSAHTGKCLVVNFGITGPDTIRLDNPLRDIQVPMTINGVKGTTDPAFTVKGTGSGIGLNVLYEGVNVNNLSFANWYSGISLKNDYALISHNNVVNTRFPMTITGNNNTVQGNCLNCNFAGTNSYISDTALVIRGNNNTVGQKDQANKIINAGSVGIKVDQGKGNQLLYNTLSDNPIAIKHVRNGNMTYGAPTNLVGSLVGTVASISGKAKAGDRIQIFLGDLVATQTAAPYVIETFADASGSWSTPIPNTWLVPNNNTYFVTTATHTDGTSELSDIVRVGNVPQICYVTNILNEGKGSLRTAVDCANNAGKGSSGTNAQIVFQLSNTMNTIDLASGLVITNNYGVLVDPTTQVPVTLTTSNSTATAFTWASSNLNLANLHFENFAKTLVGSGSNVWIRRSQFNNYTTAVELSGTNQNISDNFFANGTNAFVSNGGSLNLFQNTFGAFEGNAPASIAGNAMQLSTLSNATIQGNNFKNIASQAIVATAVNDFSLLGNTITGKDNVTTEAVKLSNTPKICIERNVVDNYATGIALDAVSKGNIASNTFTQIDTYGLDLVSSKNIEISKNTVTGLSKTGKPIHLHYASATASNNSKVFPSVSSITYYRGKLVVYGVAQPYDSVEFFRSSNGIDLDTYVTTLEANQFGNWTYEESMKVTDVASKYYRATATEDAPTHNTSEASDSIHLNLKVCPVRNTNNEGDNSLRSAINGANNNECNYIVFEIGTGAATIAPTTALPIITAPYIIIDGTSQPGYTKIPLITVASPTQGYAFKSVGTPTFNMHGMHTLGYDTAVVLSNTPNHLMSYNTFEDFKTGLVDVGTGVAQGLIDSNTFVASNAQTCIESQVQGLSITQNDVKGNFAVGIKLLAHDNNVRQNTIFDDSYHATAVGLSLQGVQRSAIGYNQVYNLGYGLKAANTEDNLINYNVFGDTSKSKIVLGIGMVQSKADTLFGNKLFNAQTGLDIDKFENFNMEFHEVAKVDTGVLGSNGDNSSLRSNMIHKINVGLVLDKTNNSKVEGNRFFEIATLGVLIRNDSDNDTLDLNLIGGETLDAEKYNESIGVRIENANHHKIGLKDLGNSIFHNKKGGIVVSGGTGNIITYNSIFENDKTKARPTAFAIKLENNGNNNKVKPSFTGHKLSATKDTLTLFGLSQSGDSIHLYNGKGGYEEARVWFGSGYTDASGKFSVRVSPSVNLKKLLASSTLYLTATGTDASSNTSPLSDMYIMGDCYVTTLADTNDNDYPLANSLRMAVKCANVQNEHVGIYYSIDQYQDKRVKLQGTLMPLKNRYGVNYQGSNRLTDLSVVGIDFDDKINKDTLAWHIDPLQGPSRFDYLRVESWEAGVKIDADTQRIVHFEGKNAKKSSLYFTDNAAYSTVDSSTFTNVHAAIRLLTSAHDVGIVQSTFEGGDHAILTTDTNFRILVEDNTFKNNKDYVLTVEKANDWTIANNDFESDDSHALKAILSSNSKQLEIQGNVFLADTSSQNVAIEVLSLQQSENLRLRYNQWTLPNKETAVRLYNTSTSRVDTNAIWVKGGNAVSQQLGANNQFVGNTINVSQKDAFQLQSTDFNQISRNIVTGTSKNVKCINLNYNTLFESNEGIATPKFYQRPLSHSVKIVNKRRGLFVTGMAQSGDSVEVFFSDSLQPSMNIYIGTAATDANGAWELHIPRQYYKKDTITWYHVVATATNANKSTSETDTVYHIPPQTAKFYVLNRFNDGPNTLRDALRQVDSCDLKAYVIFRIGGTTPYRIQLDSLLAPVSSVNGFIMDGATQLDCDSADYADKRIFVECAKIDTAFALHLTTASDSSKMANMWFVNAEKGLRIENGYNKIHNINIIQEDATVKADTALWISGAKNKITNSKVMGYDRGIVIDGKQEGNSLYLSTIDSVNVGVTITNKAFKTTIDSCTFIYTDSIALYVERSAGLSNFVKSSTFGVKNKPVKGTAICIEGAKSQTITRNRIAYLQNTSDTTVAIGILIKDTASFNSIINNKVGLDGSTETAYTGWGIQLEGVSDALATRNNSITSNTLVGSSLGAIKVSHSNASIISNNIMGDTSGKGQYKIGAFGVCIDSSKNEILENNSIVNFDSSGIEVKHSDFVIMSRNILYSALSTAKGIDLNVKNIDSSNVIGTKVIQTPIIENIILLDTSNMTLSGITPYPSVVVDLYEGYKGKNHAFRYINTVTSGTDRKWTYQLKRTNFAFDKENHYLAQLKTPEGRSSELSASVLKDSLLCDLGKLSNWSVIDDLYNPCPGPAFNMTANLGKDLTYAWILTPVKPEDTKVLTYSTPAITVKDSSYHVQLVMTDPFGCSVQDTALLKYKALPFKPDFIVASEVFVDDTIIIIDISKGRDDNAFVWSSTGGTVIPTSSNLIKGPDGKMYPAERVVQMQFLEQGAYNILQRSTKEGCYYDLEKTITVADKTGQRNTGDPVLPEMEELSINPNPVVQQTAKVHAVVAHADPVDLQIINEAGVVVENIRLSGKTDYKFDLSVKLPSAIYTFRLITKYKTLTQKVVVLK